MQAKVPAGIDLTAQACIGLLDAFQCRATPSFDLGHHGVILPLGAANLTLPLLETMGIPYRILPEEETNALDALDRAIAAALERSGPAALIARKGVFSAYPPQPSGASPFSLTREGAIRLLADRLDRGAVVVATTGKASRELFEYRAARGGPTGRDFLTVGSMGHASQIALGVALARSDREIWCLDGDGAVIMHMGALAVIGSLAPRNFRHVVFNNGAHDSVGGQPTAGLDIDLPRLAAACGYRFTASVATAAELEARWKECARRAGPVLLEIRVRRGARSDLGRPSGTPVENRDAFQRFLRE